MEDEKFDEIGRIDKTTLLMMARAFFTQQHGCMIEETAWEGESGTVDVIGWDEERLYFANVYLDEGEPMENADDVANALSAPAREWLRMHPQFASLILTLSFLAVTPLTQDTFFLRHNKVTVAEERAGVHVA